VGIELVPVGNIYCLGEGIQVIFGRIFRELQVERKGPRIKEEVGIRTDVGNLDLQRVINRTWGMNLGREI
jgi:hypothetical protein